MTKIEEVARAIYAANSWWRAVEDDDDGLGRYKDGHGGDRFRAVEWEQLSEEDRRDNLDSARAAIEAMRALTANMEAAGNAHWDAGCHTCGDLEFGWSKLIDAALAEKPE